MYKGIKEKPKNQQHFRLAGFLLGFKVILSFAWLPCFSCLSFFDLRTCLVIAMNICEKKLELGGANFISV